MPLTSIFFGGCFLRKEYVKRHEKKISSSTPAQANITPDGGDFSGTTLGATSGEIASDAPARGAAAATASAICTSALSTAIFEAALKGGITALFMGLSAASFPANFIADAAFVSLPTPVCITRRAITSAACSTTAAVSLA